MKIYEGDYEIVKCKKPYLKAFANIISDNEISVIAKRNTIKKKDIIEVEKNWKLIKFDYVLNFNLVGFISKISKALADKGISIFVISAYSTDYILVKKQNIKKAIKILKSLKF